MMLQCNDILTSCQYFPTLISFTALLFQKERTWLNYQTKLPQSLNGLTGTPCLHMGRVIYSHPLKSVDMADQKDLQDALAKENQEFQENIAVEVSHVYLTFFYHIL